MSEGSENISIQRNAAPQSDAHDAIRARKAGAVPAGFIHASPEPCSACLWIDSGRLCKFVR